MWAENNLEPKDELQNIKILIHQKQIYIYIYKDSRPFQKKVYEDS